MAQTPTVIEWHACLQQRSALSSSLLEMQVQLGPVGYIDPPSALAPILLCPCNLWGGSGEILADVWYTDGSSPGNPSVRTAVTT